MKNVVNVIAAIIKAILSFAVFGFIALVLYNDIDGIIGIVISGIVACLGLFISLNVFKYVKRRGIMEALTENASTSDMDNLAPTPLDDYRAISVSELINNFKNKNSLISSGKLRIWGDWNKRDLDVYNNIVEIEFLAEEKELIFSFENGNILTVSNPLNIYEATTYLKIIKATKIKWEWNNKEYFQLYEYKSNGIISYTNCNWKISEFDTSVSKNAFILLN